MKGREQPLLHNNALDIFNGDPSVKGRLAAFEDAMEKLLWPQKRPDKDSIWRTSQEEGAEWHQLEILNTSGGGHDDLDAQVEFIARFSDKGTKREHHEVSSFRKVEGRWYLTEGKVMPAKQVVRSAPKTGRNDPCPCGIGRKYKKCCAS